NTMHSSSVQLIRLIRNPVIGIIENNGIIKEFRLYQNYPNPFNPITKIKFDVSANSPLSRELGIGEGLGVRLLVYDIQGKEVVVLVNESLKPGSYEVTWDASNYPSGIYFYEFTSNNFNQSKKLVLIK